MQDDKSLINWLERHKGNKYTSPEIQNEMIEVMTLGILKEVSENIKNAKFFTIMADETADVANKEQVVICFRWVDDDLNVHEDFVGMEPIGSYWLRLTR